MLILDNWHIICLNAIFILFPEILAYKLTIYPVSVDNKIVDGSKLFHIIYTI